MNPLIIGIIAAGAILAAGFIKTGTALLDLKPSFSKLRYVKQAGFWNNLTRQKFSVDLSIENPNKKTVEFQKFIADVTHNGKKIAEINAEKKVPIRGKDITILSGIIFSVDTFALGNEIWNLLLKKENTGLTWHIDIHRCHELIDAGPVGIFRNLIAVVHENKTVPVRQ